jgi:glycosyltransferase involved in cell wall biosynthesis
MSGPLVSCVIPAWNAERFIEEAIRSVLDQTYGQVEIIVVDDGSTDGTADVVQGFGDRVRYVAQENAGPATARNRGVAEATGAFLSFLDADDLWVADKLAKQLARFRARPDLSYSVGMVQNFWEDEVAVEAEHMASHARARPIAGYVTLTLLVRRESMERVGGFDIDLSHGDAADWFQRADSMGAVGEMLDDVLARRRLHAANRSRTMASASRDEFLLMLKRRLDAGREGGP